MLALPLLVVSLALAADAPSEVAEPNVAPPPAAEVPFRARPREPFQPAAAVGWILAEQGTLFLVNGYIARPPSWEAPSYGLFRKAWTEPTLATDGDGFAMNAFLHPCMGAHFYMAARNHGFTSSQAAMVSILGSFAWEYVIESWFTRPVVFDLIATPMLGVPLGMLLSHVKGPIRRIGPRWLRGVVMIPIDPIEGVDTLIFGGPPHAASW